MKVAVVKYNAGNIQSVLFTLKRLGVEPCWTDDPAELRAADKVIFPGVGEASSAMQYLRAAGLDEVIRSLTRPLLGICLGMQLLCRHSEENDTECLGIFTERVVRFPPRDKVPHIGWNQIAETRGPLFQGFTSPPYMYFVHSYCMPVCEESVGTTHYIWPFSSAAVYNNFFGVQFHPEKSGECGEMLLGNFLSL